MGAIQEILNNPQYKSNVQKLSKLFKDQPDNPLTRAVYWVEYVIRHNGGYFCQNIYIFLHAGFILHVFYYYRSTSSSFSWTKIELFSVPFLRRDFIVRCYFEHFLVFDI